MAETLDVTGGQLVYDEFGEGPETIVFVHGAGGNHLSWWQQIPAYRDRYRCVTYEVRGWGRSRDDSGEGRKAFARDLGELMDALDIPEAVLVGQSMGGFTILPFAVRNPQRVRGLLMADTFLGIDAPELIEEMRRAVQSAQENQEGGGLTRMVGPAYLEQEPHGVFLYNQIRGLNPPLDPNQPLSFGQGDGAVSKDELGALTMPVIFLAGAEDAIIPAELIERAAEMVPGAQYFQVPEAGHSVYWEQPDDFNRILDALLAESFA
ncbi:MAG: alpha/beta hydrolase [Chloroflexi bacterium]|nr:alpha/beta hydrolase [Chloroflexota bacterium]MCY3695669.1 alpha/beta hydrolase [Chloroflexota bacterium]MXX80517.1 alpha/beta hydrolase [Chloroflexota bacterium]MYF23468.1 alpha/beta hydrolase [Chloroflexota bacterium]